MKNYVLTCCSTVDLPADYFKKRDVPFISYHFILDDKEYIDDLGKTISYEDFYQKMKEGAMPRTSQINTEEFINFFEPFLKEKKDILHIAFSSGLSGTYNSACLARDELKEKYPERKIIIIDSLAASLGYGLLVDAALDLRDNGENIEKIANWLEKNKLNVQHWFFSTDLTHYKRGGRISPSSAFFGNLLNICPILYVNNEGKLMPRFKARGKKQAIKRLVEFIKEYAEDNLNYDGKCFISHSASEAEAKKLEELIKENFSSINGPIMINSIGAIIGSHTGPGTVALFFFGKKRKN